MKKIKDIKDFCKCVLSAVGSGYIYYKVNKIPTDKAKDILKLERILKKIDENYNTDKNKDWRYRNKRNGFANYQAFYYLENIYIFRTSGKYENKENGFLLHKDKIEFQLSEHLGLTLFRDERNKLTFKLSKTFLRAKKERLKIAIINKNGRAFHNEIKLLGGFPPYRGIQIQKVNLKKYINKLQKNKKFQFSLPKYL